MKFRKKPVVIEASQWFKNGDHPLDYSRDHEGLDGGELRVLSAEERKANQWEGDVVRYFRAPDVSGETACKHCGLTMHVHGWIDTLEGGHIVCPGDWIIQGVKGEFYPCKPDIFAETYEEISEDNTGTMETRSELLDWAVTSWHEQVAHRPMENVYRRTLDSVWRQVIRFAGEDPQSIIGPSHDDLLHAATPNPQGGE